MKRLIFFTIFFGLISFFANAQSDTLLFSCPDVKTSPGAQDIIGQTSASITAPCTVPSDISASRLVLSYALDDGGDIYINGTPIFSIPNTFGVDIGAVPVSYPVPAPGSTINIQVIAKNGYQSSGELAYAVYGKATIQFWGAPTPPPTPPPGSVDTTPPTISNVRITNITTSSATVIWTTDESATSQVEYCISASRCGVLTPVYSGLVTSHSVNLVGLTPNTSYYVWVKSADGVGNLRTAGYYLFRTLSTTVSPSISPTPSLSPSPSATPKLDPPVLSNIQVISITRDSVTVTWDTDIPADTRVGICSMSIFCKFQILDTQQSTSHIANINNLRANTNYSIRARSSDLAGNSGTSSLVSFKTSPGLVISNIQIKNLTQYGTDITWDTNYSADSAVVVCTFFFWCYAGGGTFDLSLTLNHQISISLLLPNTKYYYRITSRDSLGYVARSMVGSFTTPGS